MEDIEGHEMPIKTADEEAASEAIVIEDPLPRPHNKRDGYHKLLLDDYYLKKGDAGSCGCGSNNHQEGGGFAPFQKLFADDKIKKNSIICLQFAVFVDAVNSTLLQPNFPIMVLPPEAGGTDESFSSTEPFDFNAATYFIPMTGLLGVAIASVVIGSISDKIGRKPCILICLWGSIGGQMLKFFLRFNFWAFCAANLVNGLVSATVPVGLAYLGDISRNQREKDQEFGVMVGCSMLGSSGGGIIAILMQSSGLFAPLWVGIASLLIAAIYATLVLVESKEIAKLKEKLKDNNLEEGEEEEEEEQDVPETVNQTSLWLIIGGSLADNIGSTGLTPLCLSPLMFNTYYSDFVEQGLDPIMSQVAYKWISTIVALTVIPGVLMSPPLYAKIGPAGGCIVGNIITGIITIALLIIGLQKPSNALYGVFIAVLYVGFPFTVLSQLSTGPMLDIIAPPDKRGSIQGLNSMTMNFAMAVAPWVFGMFADAISPTAAIGTCIGISFFAAGITVPLMFTKGLGPPPQQISAESKPLRFEDKELVEKLLQGEWIPPEALDQLNEQRHDKGQPYLVVRAGKFSDDKERLPKLRAQARADYKYRLAKLEKDIAEVNATEGRTLSAILDKINRLSNDVDPTTIEVADRELGTWFVDWLKYSGYRPHQDTQFFKQAIMTAFPFIKDDPDLTPENLEASLLKYVRLIRSYQHMEEETDNSVTGRVYSVLALKKTT